MPRTQKERTIFALITVLITVHAYIFYSIFIVNGASLTEYASLMAGQQVPTVADAIGVLGGITVFGVVIPVWAVALIEFGFAFTLEMIMGSPCSLKLAMKTFDPRNTAPALMESAIICATVVLMCPAMSLVAAFLYFPYGQETFGVIPLLVDWAELVVLNFPFAFFTQLFFIQPLVRLIFRLLFRRGGAASPDEAHA